MAGFWSAERTETLHTLWKCGHSASIIARQLHTSRNAVLGKAWREGLGGRVKITSSIYGGGERRRPTKSANRETIWSQLRVWQLKKWVQEGVSSIEISRRFGGKVSSASVRDKVYRLGLHLKRKRGQTDCARAVPQTQHPTEMERVPFLDVRANQCRFPLWSPEHKTGDCCGNKTNPGNPYCEHHMAIAYKPGTAINQQPRKVA